MSFCNFSFFSLGFRRCHWLGFCCFGLSFYLDFGGFCIGNDFYLGSDLGLRLGLNLSFGCCFSFGFNLRGRLGNNLRFSLLLSFVGRLCLLSGDFNGSGRR